MTPFQLRFVADCLQAGGVIAYPTEAVYGLGCLPHDTLAVARILSMKQRDVAKGLIVIAAKEEQLEELIDTSYLSSLIRNSWPGPNTWVIPATPGCPAWLTGAHDSLAVRVTAHPIAKQICQASESAIVSTSANRADEEPARSEYQVRAVFGDSVDYYVYGDVNKQAQPTLIRDARTTEIIRPA